MGIDLYVLRKKAIIVRTANDERLQVHFLQPAIRNALAPDARTMVDCAVNAARREWRTEDRLPQWVLQIGEDGRPQPGMPVFRWNRLQRVYCFDNELLQPAGYLGERVLGGFRLRTVAEQDYLNDQATAHRIDEGQAHVYKDFWRGERFRSGAEYLAYRRGNPPPSARPRQQPAAAVHPSLSKIISLIEFIQAKGNRATPADIQYLGCLKNKAGQLGCSL